MRRFFIAGCVKLQSDVMTDQETEDGIDLLLKGRWFVRKRSWCIADNIVQMTQGIKVMKCRYVFV